MLSVETVSIRATSRASIAIRNKSGSNDFYTFEYCEERAVHFDANSDRSKWEDELNEERAKLWELCNEEVDKQIKDIYDLMHSNR